MAKNKDDSKKKQTRATPLSRHRRYKKTLHAPFSGLTIPMQLVSWTKDRLPEFLWIHFVLSNRGIGVFHAIMDYLDGYSDAQGKPLFGTISSFDLIPPANREALVQNMSHTFRMVFAEWGHIAKLYPDMPGNWLFLNQGIPQKPRTLEESLAVLKSMVREILDSQGSPATMPRAAALARLIKHDKFKTADKEFIESLRGYPQADEVERRRAESMIRATTLALLNMRTEMGEWSKYFWRQNFRISVCEEPAPPPSRESGDAPEVISSIFKSVEEFEADQRGRLETALQQITIDLYNPTRQEVLLGIIARQFRLLCALLADAYLWSEDLASHLVRAMVENLITMKYLEGNPSLYTKFVEYGLGQLKLYKLHLQDLEESQEPADPELTAFLDQLEATIDSERWEESLPIHWGSWSGKPEREMAVEVNMERAYKLIYQPHSLDVHGTWTSLTRWNMVRCRNPLHLFHHIPLFRRPTLTLGIVPVALDLFEETLSLSADALKVPMSKSELLEPLYALRKNLTEVLS